jgi:ACS family hexuronate transporter-like MFS transporter
MGGTLGYVGATIFQVIVGYSVEKHHNYYIPFICSGLAYLVAFGVIHVLMPKLEPARIEDASAARA